MTIPCPKVRNLRLKICRNYGIRTQGFEETQMHIKEARSIVGQSVVLTWTDRKGGHVTEETFVHKADFVPMYGPCLFTDHGEIQLDRITSCEIPAAAAKTVSVA